MMTNGVVPCPHPKAKEIKSLFFRLYDKPTQAATPRSHSLLPRDFSSDTESSSPRSALPSLTFSDNDMDVDSDSCSSMDFSDCEGDVRSDSGIGDDASSRPLKCTLSLPSLQRSDDSNTDLVPITPISSNFPLPPMLTCEELVTLCEKLKRPWQETLVSGVSVDVSWKVERDRASYHVPYLDDLKYAHALKLVKTLPSWDAENLITLAKELIWCAIEPQLSDYLSLRDIKRVTMFASAVKSAFLEVQGEDVYSGFVDALVDVAVGIFMRAWNIEKDALLFTHYLPLHVQATIRLTAFIGDLYVCGTMKHVCFRACFLQVLKHVDRTYEAVMALRVLLESIGKDKSPFWQIEYADQLLHSGRILRQCGLACNCLTESGITERPGFWEGVRRYKNECGRMFYERIVKARIGSGKGGMASWTYEDGASVGMIDAEIEIMFLQMGMGKRKYHFKIPSSIL